MAFYKLESVLDPDRISQHVLTWLCTDDSDIEGVLDLDVDEDDDDASDDEDVDSDEDEDLAYATVPGLRKKCKRIYCLFFLLTNFYSR